VIDNLLLSWRSDPEIAANMQVQQEIAARPAQTVDFPLSLHPALVRALRSQGIRSLYTHQAASLEKAQAGQNIMIVTGTASGKTLCYNLPVLDRLLRDPDARALYLFPTKALAQDQAAALRGLLHSLSEKETALPTPPLGIYDGDTPAHVRPAVRNNARLLFSNPDMLHIGLLPHHTNWVDFFRNLRFVIIDEAHVYRGVFGSHVANVLRRLQRIARFYGAQPQFILTSATIANPQELAMGLIASDESISETELIDQDGAARGPRSFLIYNPPVVDPELGIRRSALQESVRLAQDLLAYHVQTIIFGRSRRTVELILSYLRQSPLGPLPSSDPFNISRRPDRPVPADNAQLVRGYRSGYLPEQRREIERGLRQGAIQAVVATNALELGIDIGGMGAAVLVGYPGTIAALRQQAGRAGRGSAASLAVLVATADPIDQFLASHPEYLFKRSPEHALINPDNPLILLDHLRCAAFELPFKNGDSFGTIDPATLAEYLAFLQEQGLLHASGERYFWMADQYPAQAISLRSAGANPIQLQVLADDSLDPSATPSRPVTLGQVDRASAYWMVHPNAIYLHEAESFRVEELDLEQGVARLRRVETDYYTLPRRETTVALVELQASQPVVGALKSYGEIQVTTQLTGYRKVRWFTHEHLAVEELTLPPVDLLTTGYWIALAEETVDKLKELGLWSNAPNDYGPDWEVQRNRARQRDGFRCQLCGAPEGARAHPVHHKTPFRTFSSYIQANILDNLITLCPECHRRVETAVRVRSGLAGLAFVLGNLAPFFLMCDPRDLGVHSDPQSPLADGQPAVVIYDQVPAGLGFSQRLFELHAELLQRARDLVSACPCNDGCPSCVGPGGEQGAGGKAETLAILDSLSS
jgi:DEAD/DEAH box helicase domain-containing protein